MVTITIIMAITTIITDMAMDGVKINRTYSRGKLYWIHRITHCLFCCLILN